MNLWQSNGAPAGQEIFHLHVHLFPRREGDGWLQFYPPDRPQPAAREQAELKAIAAPILAALTQST